MDKSSITWTRGSDWWLSRTTMSGRERFPKRIRVGHLDRPRVYYPINRDALLALADEIERKADEALDESAHSISEAVATSKLNEYTVRNGIAQRIRKALGAVE